MRCVQASVIRPQCGGLTSQVTGAAGGGSNAMTPDWSMAVMCRLGMTLLSNAGALLIGSRSGRVAGGRVGADLVGELGRGPCVRRPGSSRRRVLRGGLGDPGGGSRGDRGGGGQSDRPGGGQSDRRNWSNHAQLGDQGAAKLIA